jgi:hypothetical protein
MNLLLLYCWLPGQNAEAASKRFKRRFAHRAENTAYSNHVPEIEGFNA